MAEGTGLENRQAFARFVGSNPTSSADGGDWKRTAGDPMFDKTHTKYPFGEVAEWLKALPC